jgi:hypothetical protein
MTGEGGLPISAFCFPNFRFSAPPSQIVEDRLPCLPTGNPGAVSAKVVAKSHQPAGRASGPCRNFRPHDAPKASPTSGAPGKPLALRLPASPQATAPVSPGRQKSEQRGPRFPLSASIIVKLRVGVAQRVLKSAETRSHVAPRQNAEANTRGGESKMYSEVKNEIYSKAWKMDNPKT